jgi:hypothetical protein
MPVCPAITAGTQPPLGVTETAQPSASAASTLVVPRRKERSNSASAVGVVAGMRLCQLRKVAAKGLVPPW